jgi:adenosylhomocysteine nucleosidase
LRKADFEVNVLFVAALEDEVQGLLEQHGLAVLYVGVGKVNATYHLTQFIYQARADGHEIDLVINVGTAGSSKIPTHSVVECTQFLQRDMDVRPLGFQIGETPFDPIVGEIRVERKFRELPEARCGSGDNFETMKADEARAAGLDCDVVDMEAFALAKVCQHEKIEFASVKYITDGSDHGAANDWKENVPKAARVFADLAQRFL